MVSQVQELDSVEELKDAFQEVAEDFDNASYENAFEAFLPELRQSHEAFFDAGAGPAGPWSPWFFRPPDAPSNHKTLQISGRLRQSLVGGSDHIEEVGDREFVFGTSVEYAGIHQFGASVTTAVPLVGRNGRYLPAGSTINVPARPFVGFTDESLASLLSHVGDEAVESLKEKDAMSENESPAEKPEEVRDPEHVVWHRDQRLTDVRGPEGRLRFKTTDPIEAEQLYREHFGIDPNDETAVVQAVKGR